MAALTNFILLVVLSYATSFVLCAAAEEFKLDLASVVVRNVQSGINGVEWDYSDGPNGPANWGKTWPACSKGVQQNPIDIQESHIILDVLVDVPAHIHYKPAPAFATANGKVLEVEWPAGIFYVHQYYFTLEKLVFHSPSEHTYFGERFPLEIQFIHTHPTEGYSNNVIVFHEGEANEWLQQIVTRLPTPGSGKQSAILGTVDPVGIEGSSVSWKKYYRVLGSVTVPPCTENPYVTWSLLKEPLTASKEQIDQIASLLEVPSFRPVQSLEGRSVYYPKSQA